MSFFEQRRAFVVIGGTVILQPIEDKRTCHEWCKQALNISCSEWDNVTRGHVLGNNMTIYTGGDVYAPDTVMDPETAMGIQLQLMQLNALYDGTGNICNGVRPQYGSDVAWPHVFVLNKETMRWELV